MMTQGGVKPTDHSDVSAGLYVKELNEGGDKILFLFNCTGEDRTVPVTGATHLGGDGEITERGITLKNGEMGYYRIKE